MVEEIRIDGNSIFDFWEKYGDTEFDNAQTYRYNSENNLWEVAFADCLCSGLLLSIECSSSIELHERYNNIDLYILNNLIPNEDFRICLIHDKKYILLGENYRFEEIKILKKETGIHDAINGNCNFTKSFGIRDLNTMKWVFYDNNWCEKIENKDNEKQSIHCYKGEKTFSEKCDSCCSAGDQDICSFDPLWKTSLELELELENENCEDTKQDNVNHPSHYTQGKIECIDYIMDKMSIEGFEGYCQGNILKYVTRYKHKNGVEDLKKAIWYINKLIETLEKYKQK